MKNRDILLTVTVHQDTRLKMGRMINLRRPVFSFADPPFTFEKILRYFLNKPAGNLAPAGHLAPAGIRLVTPGLNKYHFIKI